MTFSEDPTSPAAPFSGDPSGQIFDMPDMVQGSATTSERVVDTQSGFLVVIKRLGDKLALSVKRRVGTPPTSSVALTPDESLKLSRILSTSLIEDESAQFENPRAARRRSRAALNLPRNTEIDDVDTDSQSSNQGRIPMKLMLLSVLRTFTIPIVGIVLTVFAVGFGIGVCADKASTKAPAAVVVDPLATEKVDTFVRDFVARMLDFNANTYRASQVQAMASMSPELLEQYWKETKFPLSKRQLASLPTGTNIMITEMKQERLDAGSTQVIVKALLSDAANPKVGTPVNLKLKLVAANGTIVVTEQEDVSSVK